MSESRAESGAADGGSGGRGAPPQDEHRAPSGAPSPRPGPSDASPAGRRDGAAVRRNQPQRGADARARRARRAAARAGLIGAAALATWAVVHRLRHRARLRAADRVSRQRRGGKDRRRVAAQVRAGDRLLRLRLGLSGRRAAAIGRPGRAGVRHAGDAARLDRDVAAGGGHSRRVRRRHAADDRRRRPRLRRAARRARRCPRRRHGDRRHRLFPRRRPAPARRRRPQHLAPGGEGLAHRRARAGQAQFGRGAATGRERQPGQVAVSRDHEP